MFGRFCAYTFKKNFLTPRCHELYLFFIPDHHNVPCKTGSEDALLVLILVVIEHKILNMYLLIVDTYILLAKSRLSRSVLYILYSVQCTSTLYEVLFNAQNSLQTGKVVK